MDEIPTIFNIIIQGANPKQIFTRYLTPISTTNIVNLYLRPIQEQNLLSQHYLQRYCKLCISRDEQNNIEMNEFCALVLADYFYNTTHPSSTTNNNTTSCKLTYSHVSPPLHCFVLDPYLTPDRLPPGDTLGLRIWEAGLILTEYLIDERNHTKLFQTSSNNNVIVEIGAGIGLPGLTCAMKLMQSSDKTTNNSTKIILTDFSPLVVSNILQSVKCNPITDIALNQKKLHVCQFDWIHDTFIDLLSTVVTSQNLLSPLNILLLASDIIYDPLDVPGFVTFLHSVLAEFPTTKVLFSNTIRNQATFTVFEKQMEEIGLKLHLLQPGPVYFYENCSHMLNPKWERSDVRLFELISS
jgi:hypothetical protein